jgi:hypothetical protein
MFKHFCLFLCKGILISVHETLALIIFLINIQFHEISYTRVAMMLRNWLNS